MSSFKALCTLLIAVSLSVLSGCGDNLAPSGADQRPAVQAGSTGASVSQKAPDFSVSDTNGNIVTLASALAARKAAVFYFTMWCPICDTHMRSIRSSIAPSFPTVGFYLVDYLTGSVSDASSAASANGYAGGVFTILADTNHTLTNNFLGTMGTTVVVDNTGIIRMNEDYQDGTRLQSTLAGLP
ncbi:MAG: redoxin domain-containing protein [Verrucomicrobia bacterium]|nr:redoxin domain-containing protein [Deltaproteobacteria bacterium]